MPLMGPQVYKRWDLGLLLIKLGPEKYVSHFSMYNSLTLLFFVNKLCILFNL